MGPLVSNLFFVWKYRLLKWDVLCQPKLQGGLGIQNLDIKNKCLLSKWLFKLLNEEGMWQELVRNKYLKNKPLGACVKKTSDSHFCKGLMNVKESFMRRVFQSGRWLASLFLGRQMA